MEKVGYIGILEGVKYKEMKILQGGSFEGTYDRFNMLLMFPVEIIQGNRLIKATAIFDTGATLSTIAPHMDNGLQSIEGMKGSVRGNGIADNLPVFDVELEMPSGIKISGVELMEYPATVKYDVIIGMDVISLGKLTVGEGKFSFEIKA